MMNLKTALDWKKHNGYAFSGLCCGCEKLFYSHNSDATHCTTACANSHRKYPKSGIWHICPICGTKKYRNKKYITRTSPCCSQECRARYGKGPHSSNWKNGKSLKRIEYR